MKRLLLPFVLSVLAAGCQLGSHMRSVGSVSRPLEGAAELVAVEVFNPVGTIAVREADAENAPGVSVEVLLTDGRSRKDFVPRFEEHVELVRTGDRLQIRSAHAGAADERDWQLQITVRLPAGVGLELRQGVGAVEVAVSRARALEVALETGTVNVDVAQLEERVRVSVETGGITFATAETVAAADCQLRCETGTITLRLPEPAGGDVDLATDCGSIDLGGRAGLRVQRQVTEASCRGRIGDGGARIHARVDTGTIRLR